MGRGSTMVQLGDIMTTKVLTTSAERPVAEVTSMMVKARVGSAVVVQGSWLAGILTERDVLRAAASGSDLTKSPASEWMTRSPFLGTYLMELPQADLSGRIRTCGQNKLHAHLFGEERVAVGFQDQWIDNSSMADRDPTLTVDKTGQRHFSHMAWINKGPTTSITAPVTP